jgi:uncharacterized membrane protein YidH (DUF202 family)
VIPALGRWRQEDGRFEAGLGYIVSSMLAWTTWQDPVSTKKTKESSGICVVICGYTVLGLKHGILKWQKVEQEQE